MNLSPHQQFIHSLVTISLLLVTIIYGLVLRPLLWHQHQLALEMIFLFAAMLVCSYLMLIGFSWKQLIDAITQKLTQAIPTLLILFAIGLLIAAWMVSGTIPYLIYIGLTYIAADHIYLMAFALPIVFSLCTGTSWGSIATVGLVIISVANVIGADIAITAGAIVGGAYFGDKLSPLSDTTNIAAVAVDIDVYQHIQSMLVTTVPAALMALASFCLLDALYPATLAAGGDDSKLLQSTLHGIKNTFTLNIWLLLPPVIILIAAIKKYPPLPTLIMSTFSACVLALTWQNITVDALWQTLNHGFELSLVADKSQLAQLPQQLATLFNRGGLYALITPIVIILLVFIYLGALDCLNAMPTIINKLLTKINSERALITLTLLTSGCVNALTSSQYANSFVVGQSFKQKYDQIKLPRKVLSRSLEDTGTMLESLLPWSTTSVFIYVTLGVAIDDYWHWQLLSLFNIAFAFLFAWCGIGYFQLDKKEQFINGQQFS